MRPDFAETDLDARAAAGRALAPALASPHVQVQITRIMMRGGEWIVIYLHRGLMVARGQAPHLNDAVTAALAQLALAVRTEITRAQRQHTDDLRHVAALERIERASIEAR